LGNYFSVYVSPNFKFGFTKMKGGKKL